MRRRIRTLGSALVLASGLAWLASTAQPALQAANNGVITGDVTSDKGPEAGVWVIAEADLKTKFRKIVVTNDQGRFLLPELPNGTYRVWVRGYGLVDSQPVTAKPDQNLKLSVKTARTPQEAAAFYPASYWLSLMNIPSAKDFPGTGPQGNGINPNLKSQAEWINNIKGCERCHQVGSKITRTIPDRDAFPTSAAAWDHRVQRGQRGALMSSFMTGFGRDHGLKVFADWTDRIAAGEVPEAPPRPRGIERNVVITMWNWANEVAFMHDEIATDKRNPRVNPFGPVYGVDIGNDYLTIVDPLEHSSKMVKIPLQAGVDQAQVPRLFGKQMINPWRYFGDRIVWDDPANPHNPMMDAKGRVWLTTNGRAPGNPDWCKEGSDNKYAKYFPVQRSMRQTGYYDPKSGAFTLIDTCFGTHHLQFAEDSNDTLYFSGGGPVVGWVNTKQFDKTTDGKTSQGWCPTVIDTNGDGRITKPWNEPVGGGAGVEGEGGGGRVGKMDPTRDTRVNVGAYGIVASPLDHAAWIVSDDHPGKLVRLDPGRNPPETCISEIYEAPVALGYRTRGIDVDRQGVIWMALSGNSVMASFDRRKCSVFGGPNALGHQCDAAWKFYAIPGAKFRNSDAGTDFHYYNWVDQYNTLGVGANVPIANGSNSDSLIVLKPDTNEWITMRVPYPQGFHSRGVDGRIDDPKAGWKGRGLYATYGADAAWHVEGGPREPGNLVKFQIRPDPLAK